MATIAVRVTGDRCRDIYSQLMTFVCRHATVVVVTATIAIKSTVKRDATEQQQTMVDIITGFDLFQSIQHNLEEMKVFFSHVLVDVPDRNSSDRLSHSQLVQLLAYLHSWRLLGNETIYIRGYLGNKAMPPSEIYL
jgi:hypothetical protein